MAFLDVLSDFLDHLAADRRANAAAQQVQAPAALFAQAWNTAGGPEPLRATTQDPVRGPVTFFPVCDAAVSDDGQHLYITLTVPSNAPLSTDDLAAHAEAVRQAVRGFFQVAVRPTGMDVRQMSITFVYEAVRPILDSTGAALVGYTKSGRAVYLPFIGEVTAITGDAEDVYLPWIGAAYSVVEQRALDPAEAVASTDVLARQACHGVASEPQLIALGDAVCSETERPVRVDTKTLALARRGLVENSRADVERDRWALRPTQTIRCDGDTCVVEKNGRTLRFTPAWTY